MSSKVTRFTIVGAALYSIIAFGSWIFVNEPFARVPSSATEWGWVLVWLVAILAPYVLLYIGYRLATATFSQRPVLVASIVALLIALPLYGIFFAPNDGEASLLFAFVPILQGVVAVIGVSLTALRVRGLATRTPNPRVESDANAHFTRTR
jgi:hypothetical protein